MTPKPDLLFRMAQRDDLASIVALLSDDVLGSTRESAGEELHACYLEAYDAIESDPGNELIVAVASGEIIGTLQITYAPNLTHQGSLRATIEGVRVSSSSRSLGVGTRMLQWAIDRCRSRKCGIVQLTTDLTRDDAIAFYTDLGFVHTHAGLKLRI